MADGGVVDLVARSTIEDPRLETEGALDPLERGADSSICGEIVRLSGLRSQWERENGVQNGGETGRERGGLAARPRETHGRFSSA